MLQNSILPDDPRLTAYALDEMAPAEREEFEKLLQQDAAARQVVEDIRTAVASLTTALATEYTPAPLSAKDDLVHAGNQTGKNSKRLDGGLEPIEGTLPKTIKFPQFYYMISGLAAACFAVFFVYWQQSHPIPQSKKYIEVPLTASAQNGAPAAEMATVAGATVAKAKVAPSAGSVLLRKESQSQPAAVAFALPPPAPAGAPSDLADKADSPVVASLEEKDEAVAVAPFAVAKAPAGGGYMARSTLAGSRAKTALKDIGSLDFRQRVGPADAESYAYRKDNDYLRVADQPLSTLSADVDTASYANVRRFLNAGQRPPVDAVRIEEMVNYFPYDYAGPRSAVAKNEADVPPFSAHLEVASAPWAPEHRLVRIGLKGREVTDASRPAANLVFLLDVSGSMDEPNKLPLVKQSLRLLVGKLRPDDRVAITVYAGASGLALPSTAVSHKAEILDAIDRLEASGSTNGAMGIQLAYDIAKANFIQGGVNRVILATDGDFNVGVTSEGDLVRLIEEKAKSGVFLSVLGFGMGNLKDNTLEKLADKGNGNYAYVDSLAEARKSLVEQAGGTLVTIAKDVKLQVEFNPALVQAYRLIGYENRLLAKDDFNNDKVDAGEIGAGHTMTALYEVVPVGVAMATDMPAVDPLEYQLKGVQKPQNENRNSAELLTVKIRYKDPAGDVSRVQEIALQDTGTNFAEATTDFKFASAVAAFGMALRDSPNKGSASLADIAAWGRAGIGQDVGGYRSEFIGLVERFGALIR